MDDSIFDIVDTLDLIAPLDLIAYEKELREIEEIERDC